MNKITKYPVCFFKSYTLELLLEEWNISSEKLQWKPCSFETARKDKWAILYGSNISCVQRDSSLISADTQIVKTESYCLCFAKLIHLLVSISFYLRNSNATTICVESNTFWQLQATTT